MGSSPSKVGPAVAYVQLVCISKPTPSLCHFFFLSQTQLSSVFHNNPPLPPSTPCLRSFHARPPGLFVIEVLGGVRFPAVWSFAPSSRVVCWLEAGVPAGVPAGATAGAGAGAGAGGAAVDGSSKAEQARARKQQRRFPQQQAPLATAGVIAGGSALQTTVRYDDSNPEWYAYLTFGVKPMLTDVVVLEVKTANPGRKESSATTKSQWRSTVRVMDLVQVSDRTAAAAAAKATSAVPPALPAVAFSLGLQPAFNILPGGNSVDTMARLRLANRRGTSIQGFHSMHHSNSGDIGGIGDIGGRVGARSAAAAAAADAVRVMPVVQIRLVQLSNPVTEPDTLTVFVIRHGESEWNKATEDKSLFNLLKTRDHALTKEGAAQATRFNKRWQEAAEKTPEAADTKSFLSASVCCSSPLTRAAETAMLALHNHPGLSPRNGLRLLRNLREMKNRASLDTVGTASGDTAIEKRVLTDLTRLLGADFASEVMQPCVAVDCETPNWWTRLPAKDTEADVVARLEELWGWMRFSPTVGVRSSSGGGGGPTSGSHPPKSAILVGHSLFFRAMLQHQLAAEVKQTHPENAAELMASKLENAGCLRMVVRWPAGVTDRPVACPAIVEASLAFGSKFRHNTQLESQLRRELAASAGSAGAGAARAPDAAPEVGSGSWSCGSSHASGTGQFGHVQRIGAQAPPLR